MAVVVGRGGGEEGSAKRAMTRDDALCGPGASLDGTDLSMGGNQPQGGRVPKSPQQNQDGLYACPNTPQHARYPTTAHWAFLSAVLAQGPVGAKGRGGGGGVQPTGEGGPGVRAVVGWSACLGGRLPTTNMTTSRGYRRHITGRSSVMGKRAFIASLESYHRSRIACSSSSARSSSSSSLAVPRSARTLRVDPAMPSHGRTSTAPPPRRQSHTHSSESAYDLRFLNLETLMIV